MTRDIELKLWQRFTLFEALYIKRLIAAVLSGKKIIIEE